jgi:hypothetical protein
LASKHSAPGKVGKAMWNWTKREPHPEQDKASPLSDDFVYFAANVARAAAAMGEPARASGEQDTPPEGVPVTPGPEVLHIVIVSEPEPEADGPVVESTIAPSSDPSSQPTTGELDTPPSDDGMPSPLPPLTRPSRRKLALWIGIGASATLALMVVLLLVSPLILAAPVTVTIIPSSRVISTIMQVTLSTGLHPAPGSLPGRALPTLSLSETLTVPTTGIGHQQAEPGHGTVTFYNAAPEIQTIPAGTLLTGKDGVEVVTDTDAVIPAAAYPSFGEATVAAHTAITGPAGNIAANDLYGPCCRLNVSAVNHAFSGGHNARTFPMVSYQDVAKVEGVLHPQLIKSMKAAFLTDLRMGESLLTPFACREQVDGSAGIGDEATSLTLMLTETCSADAYQTQELTALVTGQLVARAQHEVGSGYTLVGNITPQVLNAMPVTGKPHTQLLSVRGTGTWAYQFGEQQIEQMAREIAGKNAAQATNILLHSPGVSQVNVGTGGTLPADPARIHVLVIEQGN